MAYLEQLDHVSWMWLMYSNWAMFYGGMGYVLRMSGIPATVRTVIRF